MSSQFLIFFFRLQWVLLILMSLLLSNSAFATEEVIEYTVQQNDNLSTVLQKLSLRPIYGKNGSLAEVLKLNPEKQESNGNCIYVGEIILLPKSMLHRPIEQAKITPESNTNPQLRSQQLPSKLNPAPKIKNKPTISITKLQEQSAIPTQNAGTQAGKKVTTPKNQVNSLPNATENKIFSENKPNIPAVTNNNAPVSSNSHLDINKSVLSSTKNYNAQSSTNSNNIQIAPAKTQESFSPTIVKQQETFQAPTQEKQFSTKTTDIFLSFAEKTGNKLQSNKNFDLENKSKIDSGLFPASKTILLALPLRSQTENRTDSLAQTNATNRVSSTSRTMNVETFLEEEENCDAFRSCKIRLWDLNNKCCKPQKTYFIFYEKNSL